MKRVKALLHQAFKMDHSERYAYNPTLHWNPRVEDYFIKAYGADRFSNISEALTRPSCYSCIRVNTLKTTSDAIVEKLLAFLQEARHQCDIDELNIRSNSSCAAMIRDARQGSYFDELKCHQVSNDCEGEPLEFSLGKDVPNASSLVTKCQLPGLDYVLFVKGSGPHKITYVDTPSLKEVIVSRKCAEAVLRGAKIFVPGVLACSAHVEKGDTIAVSVAIEQPNLDKGWAVGITRGTILQGHQTGKKCIIAERSGLYIGQGIAMMSRAGMFRVSEGVAIEMINRVFDLPSFNDVLEGEIFLQNLPSIITAHVLAPQKGERILDMCAAPGGKTTAIANLMKDEGEVVAVDRSHNKVLEIKKLAKEMGLSCISAFKLDALKAVCRRNGLTDTFNQQCENGGLAMAIVVNLQVVRHNREDEDERPYETLLMPLLLIRFTHRCYEHDQTFDNEETNQMLDVNEWKNTQRLKNGRGRSQRMGGRVELSKGFSPNSFDRVLLDAPCSALGLRPRLFAGEETVESLRNHGKYQRKMFDQAIQLVRPGGVIVYSTCTINPGENEALVRYALDRYNFLSLAPQIPRIGGPGIVGCRDSLDGQSVEEWLRPGEEELVQRFDPSSPIDTIGFFIAKFNVGQKDI
ncbi:hypothetical protein Scep_027394 [Stephania cephalantha]|uniref:SAM-dependent MTase RsmB/NOP-type domain-containing protein n=1 Tax=Stephania cephalantha TaxID=152367 RepID=A0AAP0EBB0_9MAGN